MFRRALLATALMLALPLAACGDGTDDKKPAGENGGVLNLYTARHYDADQQLYRLFEERTGVRVNRVDGSPDQLIARMRTEGANRGSADIVAVEPDLLLPVDHKAVVKVTVQYSIEHFEQGKFFLSPQFRISDARTTSGRLKSKEQTYLEAASGRAVLECDLSSLEDNAEVERPLKLSILLLEQASGTSARPIAVTQAISIFTK